MSKPKCFSVQVAELIIWSHWGFAENIIRPFFFINRTSDESTDCSPFKKVLKKSSHNVHYGEQPFGRIDVDIFCLHFEREMQQREQNVFVSVCCLSAVGPPLATQWPRKHKTRPRAGTDVSVAPKKIQITEWGCKTKATEKRKNWSRGKMEVLSFAFKWFYCCFFYCCFFLRDGHLITWTNQ